MKKIEDDLLEKEYVNMLATENDGLKLRIKELELILDHRKRSLIVKHGISRFV